MQPFRQSNGLSRASFWARGRRGFTLIELIFVLMILAVSAAFVAARMSSFFRGRALNFEARRLLSLAHYGQSRAVAEGVPIVLWLNVKDSTYGLTVQSSFNDADGDTHANLYTLDPTLSLQTIANDGSSISERDDEKLGLPEDLAFIRFTPDGFFDDSSVRKITLSQGVEAALDLVPMLNRLGYEIRPASNAN